MPLAATDLAAVSGIVFDDLTGDGLTPGEQVSGAAVAIYRDNGNGTFDQTADTLVRSTTTAADGRYVFERLAAGSYFVLQDAQVAGGTTLQRSVSPVITISGTAVEGRIVRVIDDFDQTEQSVIDTTNDGIPVTSSVAAPEAIGGERDLLVNKTSVNGAVQLNVDNPLLPNLLTFDSLATGNGDRRVTWDGPDGDATVVDDSGLGTVDLTGVGEAIGLQLQIGADLPGGQAVVRLYSDDGDAATATRFSTATLDIPQTGGSVSSAEFLPFTRFTPAPGGGVDINNVGAIELEISGSANVNGTAELVGTVGQTDFTADFANFDPVIDLSVTKTADVGSVDVGGNVTFTITVSNAGPVGATGVIVQDLLPVGITPLSDTPGQGSYDAVSGLWDIGAIAVGASQTLTITGRVDVPGSKTNTAQVFAADQTDIDSTPNNNVPTEDDQASVTLQAQQIDLSVTKAVDNANPNRGENVTFTVTVNNAGPTTATGVIVRDALPTGLTFVSTTPSQGSYNTTTGQWVVGSLPAATTQTLQIVARVDSVAGLVNTAEVIAADQSDVDSTPDNNVAGEDDQAGVTITPMTADLSLTKSLDNAAPDVGQNVTFTVDVRNDGPSPATGVVVTDLLPAGISFVSSSPSQGGYDAATGVWDLGALASAGTATLQIVGRIENAGAKTNTAQITSADQFDPDSTPNNNVPAEDDQAAVTLTPPIIDLSLAKTIDQPRPNFGDTIRYTLSVANAGPSPASGVVVGDDLPAGLTFVASTPSVGGYDATTDRWTIGDVASGQTVTLLIDAIVGTIEATTNVAEITAANEFDTDSTPGNDLPGEDDRASVVLTPASSDLSLSKTVDDETPHVGDNVTFTVTVANAGPDAATGVRVRDALPAGLAFVSAAPTQGSYDSGSGLWTVGSVADGQTASLALVATVTTTDRETNTAEVIAVDQRDPDSTPGNGIAAEDDQADVSVQGQQIDLSLTKTVDDPLPNVGDEITFTVVVRNDGVSPATGVQVRDILPAGLTSRGTSPSQGSLNTTTGVWTVGNLAVGGTASIDIRARVDQILDVENVAEIVAADQPDVDSTPGNDVIAEDDQAAVAIRTPVADLRLTKDVDNARPNLGENVTFNVTVTNDGPDTATGVEVTDLLPPGIRFVSNSLSQGSYDDATGVWTLGDLADGATATLGINGTIEASGGNPTAPKTNTAEITAADEADPDSTPGNRNPAEDDQAAVTVTPLVIDLALAKSVSDATPSLGDEVVFTVTVRNEGDDPASGVQVRDTLPEGVVLTGANEFLGSFNAATGVWFVGDLAAGASADLELTVVVRSPGTITNIAEVIAADQFDVDSEPDNNVATEDDQASVSLTARQADLSLTKTISDPAPGVGEQVVFTIVIDNAGPDDARSIVVRDVLPGGIGFVRSDATRGGYSFATGDWTIPVLAAGESATLEITATADTPGDQTNTAEIFASSEFDPDSTPGNGDADEDDQASVVFTPELIDLALMKMIDEPRPDRGDVVTYTLTISNDGPSTATGVRVNDLLGENLTFRDATASQGSYSPLTGIWDVGSVTTGQTPTLDIRALVGDTTGETNTAEVFAADQPDIDSTPDNGNNSEDDFSSVSFETRIADLSVQKSVDRATANQNEPIIFTVTLRNDGPDAATDVVVTDQLPPGLSFVEADPSIGSFDAPTGRWTIDRVAVGASPTLRILATIAGREPQINVAEVTASGQFDPDSVPGNQAAGEDDIASATVTPIVVDVSVSAMVDNDEPLEGDEITIMVTTRNDGPADATGVQLRTFLPTGLTLVSVQPGRGNYDPATGIWNVGSLPDDTQTDLVFRAIVDERGLKRMPIEIIAIDQIDIDSEPDNGVIGEDDDVELLIRAPRLLTKRLFLAR